MESIYPSIKSVNEPLFYKSYNHLAIAFTTPETQVSTDYQISGYFCTFWAITFTLQKIQCTEIMDSIPFLNSEKWLAIKKVADLPHYSKFCDSFVKKWMYNHICLKLSQKCN